MAQHGKKYVEKSKLVDPEKAYEPDEALTLVKQAAPAKFDETVEVALKLGVDPRHADQQVRGTVVLPHGTGRTVRIAVFAKGDKAKEAEEAGADLVGGDELIEQVAKGDINFDVAVATPDIMGAVGRLGRILGPKGLMPNPKTGTVTFELAKAIREIKAGKVEFRVNKEAGVHVPIGKVSFTQEQLSANFRALMDAIIKAKPAAAKGTFIRKAAVSSTMGPGIRLNPVEVGATGPDRD